MKRIQKISGVFALVVAGLLLVSLTGCDHHRYDVRVRNDDYYYRSSPVRYTDYHYVAPPRVYDRSVVVVRDRDDHDRSYTRDTRDGDRHDRDRRDSDRHTRPRRR